MTDLIERVARAIHDSDWRGGKHTWAECPEQHEFLCQARAAISAVLDDMEEPSEGMIDAGYKNDCGNQTCCWQAMLKQYRKENLG